MKILSTNFTPNMEMRNQITSRPLFESSKDTFVKSTPGFRGVEQQVATQGGKILLELGAFTAVVFATFQKLTGGSDELKDVNLNDVNNPIIGFINNILGEKDKKIKELEEEISKLRQENNRLININANIEPEAEHGAKTSIKEEDTVNPDNSVTENADAHNGETGQGTVGECGETEDVNANEEQSTTTTDGQIPEITGDNQSDDQAESVEQEVQYVKFPTKRGMMSEEQKKLKEIVIRISISPEYNDKLTAICQDILKKGAKDPQNKERMKNLSEELRECNGDKEKLKAVVDKYSVGIVDSQTSNADDSGTTVPNTEQGSHEEQNGQTEGANSSTSNGVFDPVAGRRLPGVTPKGTLDLSRISGTGGSRLRIQRGQSSIPAGSSDATGNSGTQMQTNSVTTTSEQPAALAISSKDVNTPGVYKYSRPGTVPKDAKRNLTNALKFFEKQYLAEKSQEAKKNGTQLEYVKWMVRGPVGRAVRDEVVNEVDKCKNKGPLSKYYNINRENAEMVAAAINEEPRYMDLFTFHGATRSIERFVDFNSDEPIESQASRSVRLLEDTLQKALKSGVPMEVYNVPYTYMDNNGVSRNEIHIGTNITIPPEFYSEEAKQMFGAYPIKLGICRERQRGNNALICTVYPKGVY